MPTIDDLRQKQNLPLHHKIILSKQRIKEWYNKYNGNVCVDFSGGLDSTVLLYLVREIYNNIPAIFINTGLEFPEVIKFAKSIDNIIIGKPEKTFKQIIEEFGWVFPSKDIAQRIYYAKKGGLWAINSLKGLNKDGSISPFKKDRIAKYAFLLDAPFKISDRCCTYIKEKPLAKIHSSEKLFPFIGLLAEESQRRTQAWLRKGCNNYDGKRPSSKPLSFWTKQDILKYVKWHNLKYASIYGDIIKDTNENFKCTGRDRTGCMFCLIGCHLEKRENRRFVEMSKTHPKIYKYCMEQLGMKSILNYIQIACKCKEPLY